VSSDLALEVETVELERLVRAGERGTLAQQAYRELESRIRTGQWLPNTKVSLRTLAQSLKTSMQPVRDAVGRLVAASALEMVPGRSIRVPVLTRKQADEIWSMRLLLEGEAAARKPGAEVRLLFEHTRTLRSLRYGIDVEATMRSLMDWNDDLRRGLDAPILLDMISRIYLLSAPFIAQAFTMPVPHGENFVQFTIQIQDELILAIEQGDAEAARHLRCADLRSFQRYIYSRHGW
jgi:GntR family transcriptional regulator, colanic acid and biofilm gene transcriptional regulator